MVKIEINCPTNNNPTPKKHIHIKLSLKSSLIDLIMTFLNLSIPLVKLAVSLRVELLYLKFPFSTKVQITPDFRLPYDKLEYLYNLSNE